MTQSATVHVVDDDRAFSDALVLALQAANFAANAYQDAQEFLDAYRCDMPGCLVTDVRLPSMSGLELQQHLLDRNMRIPTIFITGHGEVAMSVSAFKRGAVDFLEKPFTTVAILQSVRDALRRDARLRRAETERSILDARCARLSAREARVMSMVISDWSNKEIARALDISPRTVDHHRAHMMAKMGARSLADLILMGVASGREEMSVHALRGQAPSAAAFPAEVAPNSSPRPGPRSARRWPAADSITR
jgi:FixJ family two-component response regulator